MDKTREMVRQYQRILDLLRSENKKQTINRCTVCSIEATIAYLCIQYFEADSELREYVDQLETIDPFFYEKIKQLLVEVEIQYYQLKYNSFIVTHDCDKCLEGTHMPFL